MAESIRGINVVIGSDTTGLAAALSDVNKHARNIQSELWQVEKLLKFDPKNTELLSQKQKLLADAVQNSKEKLDRLKTAQQQVNEQFEKCDISEGQYRAFQREVTKTEQQLKKFETQLQSTNSESRNFGQRMEEVSNKLKQTGDKMKSVGESLSMKLTAPLVAGFAAVTIGTKEFREEMARLETNAQMAGASMDNMQSAMKQMQGVTGELDSNVEGLSNLLAAGFKGDKFQQVLDELSGAAIKFKDTLKFEGIADGLQETLATGQAAGSFAELLERSGIALDDFNSGLLDAIRNGEEQNYILETLVETGLANVYDQYKKTNAELVESAESQYTLQESLAELGETLEPVMTKITKLTTGLVEKFNDLSPTGQKVALTVGGIAAAIGPTALAVGSITKGVGSLSSGLSKLPGTLNAVKVGIAGISLPAVGTVAAIAAFGAIAYEVYHNWDEVKDALGATWDLIKASAEQLGINTAITFEGMKGDVIGAVDAILERLGVLEKIPFGVGDKFKGLKDNISDSAEKSAEKIEKLKKSAEENSKNISVALEGTKVAFGDLGTAVKNDVMGVVNALKGSTQEIEAEEQKQTEVVTEENQNRTEVVETEEQTQTEIVEDESTNRNEIREKFEQSWRDKLFELTASKLDLLEKEKQETLAKAEELGADKASILEYYKKKEQEIRDTAAEEKEKKEEAQAKKDEQARQKEVKAEEKKAETLASFEENWTNKAFKQSASRLEILQKEKEDAIAEAESLGADVTAIKQFYAEEAKRLKEEETNTLEAHEQSWRDKLSQLTASKADILQKEKENALKVAEELGADKTAILEYYAQKEKEIKDADIAEKQKQAEEEKKIIADVTGKWSDSIVDFADAVASGQKSFKDAMKDMLLDLITMLEKQVIASQLAATGIAWANAVWDWGVSLAKLGAALPNIALTLAGFEGLKGAVRAFADGGKVMGPTYALIGEGKDDEAVLPLNNQVYSELGRNIAANMPQPAVATNPRPTEVHLHIGTLVADDLGLKKLERTLSKFRVAETARLGAT